MAIYGALGEGFTSTYGTRPGEFLSRGLGTFSSAATLVVTVSLPVRTVTHALAQFKKTTNPTGFCTVGNYSGNTFTIYAWQAEGTVTITPAAAGGTPTSITVSGSPFSYTATANGFVGVALNGATISSLSFTRGAYGPVTMAPPTSTLTAMYQVRTGDVLIVTYSAATPTMELIPDGVATASAAAGGALSNSNTVEWAAWGTL